MILAAVSINAAFNTGIIDTAVNGAVNYAEAQRQEQVTFDELDGSLQDILKRIEEYDVGGGHVPSNPTDDPGIEPEPTIEPTPETHELNAPKYEGTGLIPVYYNETTSSWVELTSTSTADEWDNWYDYDNQQWANARTADGSMWVWIPRYEYKIDSTAKTIDVRFIKTDVKAGYTTDSTGIVKSSDGYIVHPAFMNDSANSYNNGGWDSDIEGFWVAKYPAGWQNGTNDVDTSIGTPEYSNLVYQTSANNNSKYVGTITNNSTKISYPVFKENNYAYNNISVGDAYKICQAISTASRYGLSNVDSHLEKNSEWGAVAYLAHSKYGVNGQDKVKPNTTNRSGNPSGVWAVTSPENTTNTSTTQNITGVYDLSGCVNERVAGFYQGGSTTYTTGMPTDSSSKYVTLYIANNKKGDATWETLGWIVGYDTFVTSDKAVFSRGRSTGAAATLGNLFAFSSKGGAGFDTDGFRAVLIPN